MAFNVDVFKAKGLVHHGARPALFQVRLSIPNLAKNSNEEEKVRFLANMAQIPGSSIGQVPVYYMGRTTIEPGDRTFNNIAISVLNDEDFKIRSSIEAWMNGMNTHISNRRDPNFADGSYKTSMTVYQLGKTGNGTSDVGTAIRAYTFSGLWPSDLGPIDLGFGATNTIETYTINFAYDLWVKGDTEAGDANSFNGVDGTAVPWSPTLSQE